MTLLRYAKDGLSWPDDFINKVIVGDCLEVMKQIPDGAVDLVLTSPPYNMRTRIRNGEYTTKEWSEHFSKKYDKFPDALSIEDYFDFHKKALIQMLRLARVTAWNVQIVTGSKEAVFKLIGHFHKELKDIIIWDKGHAEPAMHPAVINKQTELVLMFQTPPTAGRAFDRPYFDRGTMSDIWQIKKTNNSINGNRACFPVAFPSRIIRGWSGDDDLVLDCYLGSGSTAVAAKQLGRRFIGIEISEKYVKIAEDRLRQEELF